MTTNDIIAVLWKCSGSTEESQLKCKQQLKENKLTNKSMQVSWNYSLILWTPWHWPENDSICWAEKGTGVQVGKTLREQLFPYWDHFHRKKKNGMEREGQNLWEKLNKIMHILMSDIGTQITYVCVILFCFDKKFASKRWKMVFSCFITDTFIMIHSLKTEKAFLWE